MLSVFPHAHEQNRFLLVNAGEIMQIGILMVLHDPVGVGRVHIVGMRHHQRPRRKTGCQRVAHGLVKRSWNGSVSQGLHRAFNVGCSIALSALQCNSNERPCDFFLLSSENLSLQRGKSLYNACSCQREPLSGVPPGEFITCQNP